MSAAEGVSPCPYCGDPVGSDPKPCVKCGVITCPNCSVYTGDDEDTVWCDHCAPDVPEPVEAVPGEAENDLNLVWNAQDIKLSYAGLMLATSMWTDTSVQQELRNWFHPDQTEPFKVELSYAHIRTVLDATAYLYGFAGLPNAKIMSDQGESISSDVRRDAGALVRRLALQLGYSAEQCDEALAGADAFAVKYEAKVRRLAAPTRQQRRAAERAKGPVQA